MSNTQGQVEGEISDAVIRFEKEYMGRGPVAARTYIIEDIVLVRLKGVMTPAEHQLASGEDSRHGRDLIKQVRRELLEKGRPLLEAVVQDVTSRKVVSLHTDVSIITGERVIVFTLDAPAVFAREK